MNKSFAGQLTASKLRILLIVGVALLLLAQGGLIVLGQNAISAYGQQVSSAVALSSSNEKTLRDLESVSLALKQRESTVNKSKQLIASKEDETYTYQNRIIQDISRYAEKAGLNATGFAFASDTSAAGGASAAPAAAAAPVAGAAATTGTPAGVSPVNVTVTFAEEGSYESFYKFLQLLEGNLLRMKIDGLALSRPGEAGASTGISSLTIQAYTQK